MQLPIYLSGSYDCKTENSHIVLKTKQISGFTYFMVRYNIQVWNFTSASQALDLYTQLVERHP